ncbi:hypothetical protein [Streptomyces sp. NL15-2K]|uniref:hypothetical protein n=1 Tax=Streptomyces sp. NL15-2K TaxID=376149 RepID=UPI000F55CC2F|nr:MULTISPECIES: hypothetical protein [Actinomycetes]WKX11133.1 hypothetical protein Q4V64_27920 [Kutzneria buriramensis]GCB52076.1 hypothetical protein SNL152K_9432 [Streptomyces sp. NL15-2K]
MANVWILRQSDKAHKGEKTARLIRADAITDVSTTIGTRVVVADKASQETVVVADWQDGKQHGQPPLPPNFHIELMARLGALRKQAANNEDDLVLIAEIRDRQWVWASYKFDEL